MNLNSISKSLLIALPMLALGACSSVESDSAAQEKAAAEAKEKAQAEAQAAENEGVQTDTIEAGDLTEEELLVQEYTDAILTTTINFDFDKSVIKPEFMPVLDAHAKLLVANPDKSVTVEGHTDERGTPEYNISLGERRAISVSTYLENMGVTSSQINVVSYGEEKPVNATHNEDGWAENRRAELAY